MSYLSRLLGKPETVAQPFPSGSAHWYAARWLQWAASTRYAKSAIVDTSGAWAHLNQPNDVWFLAGSFGETVTRKCAVASKTKLFVPIFNIWLYEGYEVEGYDTYHGRLLVNDEEVAGEEIIIDQAFPVAGVSGNPVTETASEVNMTVKGMWKLLPPLPQGQHTIRITAGAGDDFNMDVTYKLSVKPRKLIYKK
ncbi:hypothetical protein [Salinibius halmophilus]|uniref:hypothetical protein n=1 Tax=Salinibius halmophilus TaxID=1853216 RepID=UPI000E669E55|nr:hypothetical protein [Salinibius halmophilus]